MNLQYAVTSSSLSELVDMSLTDWASETKLAHLHFTQNLPLIYPHNTAITRCFKV